MSETFLQYTIRVERETRGRLGRGGVIWLDVLDARKRTDDAVTRLESLVEQRRAELTAMRVDEPSDRDTAEKVERIARIDAARPSDRRAEWESMLNWKPPYGFTPGTKAHYRLEAAAWRRVAKAVDRDGALSLLCAIRFSMRTHIQMVWRLKQHGIVEWPVHSPDIIHDRNTRVMLALFLALECDSLATEARS